MKKLIISLVIVLLIIPTFALAAQYSNDDYSIEVPDSFEQVLENSFSDEEGNNINIQINYYDSSEIVEYTEDFLNSILEEIKNNIEGYRAEIKNQMLEQYGESIPETVIDELVESLKYNDFLVKEITTFGADNYQCLHYISDVSMGDVNQYAETYQTYVDGTIYTVTISSADSTFFDREDIKSSVASFKIGNYEEFLRKQEAEAKTVDTIATIVVIAAVAIVIAVIVVIVVAAKKASKKKSQKENIDIKK